MSFEEDDTPQPKITPLPSDAPVGNGATADALDDSWMAEVVQAHEKAAQVEELHMGFPSWGDPAFPTLVVTFGVLERSRVEKFQRDARKATKEGASSVHTDIAFLCEAAQKVWIRRPDTEKLVQVINANGIPARLDQTLGDMLKLSDEDNKNSYSRMMYLSKRNGVAIGAWAVTVAQWMTNTSANVAGAVVEEALVKG